MGDVCRKADVIPPWGSGQSLRASRVQFSKASFNAGQRGESARREALSRTNDKRPGIAGKSREHEKLNHERPIKGLLVSSIGDGAETR